jgi:hypothetical protein
MAKKLRYDVSLLCGLLRYHNPMQVATSSRRKCGSGAVLNSWTNVCHLSLNRSLEVAILAWQPSTTLGCYQRPCTIGRTQILCLSGQYLHCMVVSVLLFDSFNFILFDTFPGELYRSTVGINSVSMFGMT